MKSRRKIGLHMAMIALLLFGIVWLGYSHSVNTAHAAESSIIYVNNYDGSDSNDGKSWEDAFATLQQALDAADTSEGETYEIWIAAGTYVPSKDKDGNVPAGGDERESTFMMKNGVAIYGGFTGTEDSLDQRNFAENKTILSGDFSGNDEDKAYHVFFHENLGLDETAVLDGVTITGGNANGSDDHARGGGMYNFGIHSTNGSSPTLTNVTISGNMASNDGGGIYNNYSSPTLTNVTISGNEANWGGGMYNYNTRLTLTNVTISGNTATEKGGGMYNFAGTPTLTNVTISGNEASNGGGMYNDNSYPLIRNSIVWGNSNSISNNGIHSRISYSLIEGSGGSGSWNKAIGIDEDLNIDEDPQFIDPKSPDIAPTQEGDYRLRVNSPAIGAGNVNLYNVGESPELNAITTDIAGNPRFVNGMIDMGAYQYQAGIVITSLELDILKGQSVQYEILLSTEPGENVVVDAIGGADLLLSPATLTFTPTDWSVPQTVTVSVAASATINGTPVETITHSVSSDFVLYDGLPADSVTVTITKDTEAPIWPGGSELTVSDITQTSVKLSWPAATDNVGVTGYRIYVDGDERETVIGSVYATTIIGLTTDTSYTFNVTALDAEGNESSALTASAKTLKQPPDPDTEEPTWSADSELNVSDVTQTSVKLSWPEATDNIAVVGYRLYANDRMIVDQASGDFAYSVTDSVYSHTMTGLTPGTSYRFTAKAYNAAGNESEPGLSNTATTLPRSSSGGDYSGGGWYLSNNASLKVLEVWADGKRVSLTPSFTASTLSYTAITEANQIEVQASTEHSAAEVMWHDQALGGGIRIDLQEGENVITLTVQAEDGSRKTYTLVIERKTPDPKEPEQPLISFTDIAGHWAEGDIKRAATKGFVSGYPDGTFKPKNPVTRDGFTVMLIGALQPNAAGAVLNFTDADQIGEWAKQAVARAVQLGVITGYDDGSFRPDTQITRAEMAVMIARAMHLPTVSDASTGFADDAAIPQWARGAVEAIRQHGLVNGRGGNRFMPNETATRAEATVMLLRMLEQKQKP